MHAVLYLVFSEGYAATGGLNYVRGDLCAAAIRLGKLLAVLMPDGAEVLGLLALMLRQDSRRASRTCRRRARAARGSGSQSCGARPGSRRGWGYHLLHAARADLLRRLERRDEAAAAYRRALDLTANDTDVRYLKRRLLEVL